MVLSYGGAEGSRTPVRKHIHRNFSGRRRYFTFPRLPVCRHTGKLGRVMIHGTLNSLRTHGRHSDDALTGSWPFRLGRLRQLGRGENYVIVVL